MFHSAMIALRLRQEKSRWSRRWLDRTFKVSNGTCLVLLASAFGLQPS